MGATEEQMALLATARVTHVSYILILFSIAFLLFLFVCMLLHLYASYTWPVAEKAISPRMNGGVSGKMNGHVPASRSMGDAQRLRDAEEFELEGLMSDEEEYLDGEGGMRRHKKEVELT